MIMNIIQLQNTLTRCNCPSPRKINYNTHLWAGVVGVKETCPIEGTFSFLINPVLVCVHV